MRNLFFKFTTRARCGLINSHAARKIHFQLLIASPHGLLTEDDVEPGSVTDHAVQLEKVVAHLGNVERSAARRCNAPLGGVIIIFDTLGFISLALVRKQKCQRFSPRMRRAGQCAI